MVYNNDGNKWGCYLGSAGRLKMESIYTRRSVRSYSDKYVDEDTVEKIIRAGMQAPSAGNQQPWEFIVVRQKGILEKLSLVSPYAKCVDKAPVALVLLINKEGLRFPEYAVQDMGACAQNILLETVTQGLGAVWIGIAPLKDREKAIGSVFGFSDNIQPFAIMPIGYPLNDDANHFTDRFDENKVTYY